MDEKQEEKLVVEQVQTLSLTPIAHTESRKESRKRPGTFTKGDPRINRTLGPYPKEKDEGFGKVRVPPLLRDMQRIWRTEASQDRTHSQKQLRKMLEEDFRGFLRLFIKLEQEYLDAQTKVANPRRKEPSRRNEVLEDDEGNQRLGALLEEFHRKE